MDEGRDGVGARGARVPSWVPRLERRRRIARARMDDATAMATRARTKSDRGDDGDDVSRVRRGRRRARAAFEFVIDVRVLLLRVSGDVKDARERGTSRWIDELFHGDVDPFARDEIF